MGAIRIWHQTDRRLTQLVSLYVSPFLFHADQQLSQLKFIILSINLLFLELAQNEDDERYRYLLKNGIVRRVEDEDKIIFAELPQIPGVLVVYRKPSERNANPERLNLDKRDLTHMPLLEGDERLRLLNLQHNHITKIENLVSLPNLIFLDLYNN